MKCCTASDIAQMKPVRPKQRRWAPGTVFTTCVTTNWFCCTSEGCLSSFQTCASGHGRFAACSFHALGWVEAFSGCCTCSSTEVFQRRVKDGCAICPVACFLCTGIYPSRLCNTDECLCPWVLRAATFIICKLYLCSLPPALNRQDFVAAFLHSSILGRVRQEFFFFCQLNKHLLYPAN